MNKIKRSRVCAAICALFALGSLAYLNSNKVENVNVFAEAPENNVACPDCNGVGKISTGCEDCGGSNVCSFCSGVGECHFCDGSGLKDCEVCMGRGKYNCEVCSGDCTIKCPNCGGEGCDECDFMRNIECPGCKGQGLVECSTCEGLGYYSCRTCDGRGCCWFCDGDGTCHKCPDCSTCNGTGKMPMPQFTNTSVDFVNSMEVTFADLPSGVKIYYSVNNELTEANAKELTSALNITRDDNVSGAVTVYARAEKGDTKSVVVSKTFNVIQQEAMFFDEGIKYCVSSIDPNEVAVIGDPSYNFVSVQIPESVEQYGVSFNVTRIANNAFMDCTNLGTVTLPATITSVGQCAFENIKSDAVIYVPSACGRAFKEYQGLEDVTVCEESEISDFLPNSFPSTFADGLTKTADFNSKVYLDPTNGLTFKQDGSITWNAFSNANKIIINNNSYAVSSSDGRVTFNYDGETLLNIVAEGFTGEHERFNGTYPSVLKNVEQVLGLLDFPTDANNGWAFNNDNRAYVKEEKLYISNTPIASYNDEVTCRVDGSNFVYELNANNYAIKFTVYGTTLSRISVTDNAGTNLTGEYSPLSISYMSSYFSNGLKPFGDPFVNANGIQMSFVLTWYQIGSYSMSLADPVSFKDGYYTYEDGDIKVVFVGANKVLDKIAVSGFTGEQADYNGDFYPLTKIDKPEEDIATYIYNGEEQTYVLEENDAYTITNATQTNAGEYEVKVALNDKVKTKWSDGSTDDLTFTFKINKAEGKINLNTENIVKAFGETVTIPTATSNFGTVTSDKTGDLSDVGEYLVTYTLEETENYSGDTKTLKIVIKKTSTESVDVNGNKIADPVVQIIDAEKGLDQNATFVVKIMDVEKQDDTSVAEEALRGNKNLSKNEEIFALYDAKLLVDGVEVQPNGNIKIKMKVPNEIAERDYEVYHIHTCEDGSVEVLKINKAQIVDGYLVFETSKLSQFAFVIEKDVCWCHWVLIPLLVVGVALFVIFLIVMKKKILALATAIVGLIASVVFAFFSKCVVCLVFVGIDIAIFLVGILYILLTMLKAKRGPRKPKAKKVEEKKEPVKEEEPAEVKEPEEKVEEPEPEEEVKPEEPEAKESSLKESMKVAADKGAKGVGQKAAIAKYLKEKYGKEVEVNNRPSNANPGRGMAVGLPLADTHYTLKNGNRKCFVYVYDVDGNALLIVKAPAEYGESLKKNHKLVSKSAFPKTRDNSSWYSVPVDETWDDARLYKLLDDVKALTEDPNSKVDEEPEGLSLKESMKVAASKGIKGGAQKAAIAKYLKEKYGKEVEVNNRPSNANPGRGMTVGLPLADTHYTLKNGNRKCFVYVYDVDGNALLIVKAPAEYGESLKKNHKLVSKSAFPKTRDNSSWYSVPVDETWDDARLYKLLDDVKALTEDPNSKIDEEPEGLSLKESMKVAASKGIKGGAQKGEVANYLRNKYGDEVEVNNRPANANPGRGMTVGLPLADTHYTLKNGKRKCFVYVYDVNGSTLFLIKASKEYAASLKKKHKLVSKSAFPKTRDGALWFSVTIDDSWNQDDVNSMLDDVKALNE